MNTNPMKNQSKMKYFTLALSLFVLLSCGKKEKEYNRIASPDTERAVTIEEITDAGAYSYLLVREQGVDYWIAVAREDFEEGEKLYFSNFMEMREFTSKELNKTFDQILFVDAVSREPGESLKQNKVNSRVSPHRRTTMDKLLDSIKIAAAPGGISIEELYGNAEKYRDKKVIVRGQVIKINSDIMDRNWVHIMDGTRGDRSDLTFTTNAEFKVGDTVTVQGTVAVDKDFGGGYVYPLILEETDRVKQ
jgi:hypothetical protein